MKGKYSLLIFSSILELLRLINSLKLNVDFIKFLADSCFFDKDSSLDNLIIPILL